MQLFVQIIIATVPTITTTIQLTILKFDRFRNSWNQVETIITTARVIAVDIPFTAVY